MSQRYGRQGSMRNIGAMATDHGNITVNGDAIGAAITLPAAASQPAASQPAASPTGASQPTASRTGQPQSRAGDGQGVDIGVLTVLAEESRAVVDVLRRQRGYDSQQLRGGAQAHVADFAAEGGNLRVVAMQTLDRGPRSAGAAFTRMCDAFHPRVVLLVGVAGGIRDDLAVGDVVVADQVIYYDARRETEWGPRRRGQSQPMAPVLLHRLNEFFLRYGERVPAAPTVAADPGDPAVAADPGDPAVVADLGGSAVAADLGGSAVAAGPAVAAGWAEPGSAGDAIRVLRGPIGSGDAVVTDSGSDIIEFLRRFNEKTLAVETEAGGVGQTFYEQIDAEDALCGWLTIRGISDLADRDKRHDRHWYAAQRAALVMQRLLPLLKLNDPT